MKKIKTVNVNGRIPEDLKGLLDRHSAKTGTRKEKILELALRSFLEHQQKAEQATEVQP